MKTLTWQKPGQQNVAQELIKIIINYVAELRELRKVAAFVLIFMCFIVLSVIKYNVSCKNNCFFFFCMFKYFSL